MTIDFPKNTLPINTPPSGQITLAEHNAYTKSIMQVDIPEFIEVEEEIIVEEALPNIMDEIVPQNEIEEQLHITARNLNTSYEKVKVISEEVLKKNDAFQGRTIQEITRKELTQFITALSDAYNEAKVKEEQNKLQKYQDQLAEVRKQKERLLNNAK